jgi:hypothetical protein
MRSSNPLFPIACTNSDLNLPMKHKSCHHRNSGAKDNEEGRLGASANLSPSIETLRLGGKGEMGYRWPLQ